MLHGRTVEELEHDYSPLILRVRRLMIVVVMALSYGYYSLFARNYELAETGLLAFALIHPAGACCAGGLYWRRGHALGVYAGVIRWFCLVVLLSDVAAIGQCWGARMQRCKPVLLVKAG